MHGQALRAQSADLPHKLHGNGELGAVFTAGYTALAVHFSGI